MPAARVQTAWAGLRRLASRRTTPRCSQHETFNQVIRQIANRAGVRRAQGQLVHLACDGGKGFALGGELVRAQTAQLAVLQTCSLLREAGLGDLNLQFGQFESVFQRGRGQLNQQ